jgi:vibriolysin
MKFSHRLLIFLLLFNPHSKAAEWYHIDRMHLTHHTSTAGEALNMHQALHLDPESHLKETKRIQFANNIERVRYQQTYLDIPILGSNLVAENPITPTCIAGQNPCTRSARSIIQKPATISGDIAISISHELSTVKPTLTKAEAVRILQDASATDTIDAAETQLFIYLTQTKPHLVYQTKFNVNTAQPQRPAALIDAHSGEILQQWDDLHTSHPATGLGGNQKTGSYHYGQKRINNQTYYLDVETNDEMCFMQNDHVVTVDLKHRYQGNNAHQFPCYNNYEQPTNDAYGTINDAHFFSSTVYSMYENWYHTTPLNGEKVIARVHYGTDYENAFWNGQSTNFGDGHNILYPLVSLDVVAHEISHGFTQKNSGLLYYGESGAINESFSDMAAEAAEFFLYGKNDWRIGADITKHKTAMRYLNDPTLDDRSIDHIDDYNGDLDVHIASGIFNKVFYLLSHTPGWGIKQAFEVMLKANQLYWKQNSTFDSAACGVQQAATDLNYNTLHIQSAFAQVGIQPTCMQPKTTQTLLANTKLSHLQATINDQLRYQLDIPPGAKELNVTLNGGSGDADLYVEYQTSSDNRIVECAPRQRGNHEECVLTPPQIGRYIIYLDAYRSFQGVTLSVDLD